MLIRLEVNDEGTIIITGEVCSQCTIDILRQLSDYIQTSEFVTYIENTPDIPVSSCKTKH